MAEFPDIASKLTGPSKKTQFERQKAEAEAKRAREKAETAAVLKEFEASFEDEEDRYVPRNGSRGAPLPGKRHFTSGGLKSGPGTLPRSGPGSLGPADNRKRPFDDYAERRERGGAFAQHVDRRVSRGDDENEEDKVAAKPTLHLSSMPPGTSPAVIKGLFAHTPLNVEHVRILPAAGPSGPATERKSTSAIVTLATETPATDIDTVVSHLQNKYLGFGFKLSISRHLSSAALSNAAVLSSSSNNLPFGARPIVQQTSLSRAPPPNQRFAPPQSYTSSTPYSRGPQTQVTVQSPSDLKQLKLIHKTLEALLTYGPEFEALLMSRIEIQKDEKWSWLWDSASVGGVYYRWRLWEILTDARKRRKQRGPTQEVLFEGQSSWQPPDEALRFEYTTQLDDFVSDEDYNSSDEENDDNDNNRAGDLARRYNDHNITTSLTTTSTDDITKDGTGYLDPLAKAKLTHLLTRLPDSTSKLRRGDVARLTAFAIEHAGSGGDEIALLTTRNVIRPLHLQHKPLEPSEDPTSSSMVSLYIISDILSSSASAGVRHAWRYRTLFEHSLRTQHVFEKLGRAEKDYKWGKLKAEKWKRSVQNLLSLWEGWSVFPQATQEFFTQSFLNPPLTEEEKRIAEAVEQEARERERDGDSLKAKATATSRWRNVVDDDDDEGMGDVDGKPMADEDEDDDDVGGDGSTVDLDNIDGVSMVDSSDEEMETISTTIDDTKAMVTPGRARTTELKLMEVLSVAAPILTSIAPAGRKQRPKAADMFADESD